MRKRSLQERFWDKVDRSAGENGCWPWTAYKNCKGYGRITVEGKSVYAHRVAWELDHDRPVPTGLHVCHTCDHPPCMRPLHLFIGTASDNQRDSVVKGRNQLPNNRGERQGRSKLTAEDVVAIRQEYAAGCMTQNKLGKKYRVSQPHISDIVRHRTWSHLPEDGIS